MWTITGTIWLVTYILTFAFMYAEFRPGQLLFGFVVGLIYSSVSECIFILPSLFRPFQYLVPTQFIRPVKNYHKHCCFSLRFVA